MHPKKWFCYLSGAEFSYNTSYHTTLHWSPFKLLYGRDPPQLLAYESGSTNNFELEQSFQERDEWLRDIKAHLVHSQQLMKNNADKHIRDLQVVVGDLVFFKLQPYRQNLVSKRLSRNWLLDTMVCSASLRRLGLQLIACSYQRHPVFTLSAMCSI